MAALFLALGWQQAATVDADLIIINTCTVTQVADKKARNLIRRLSREHPRAILAVCGCYAQHAAEEIRALGGVHIIAGVDERGDLPALVEAFLAKDGGAGDCLISVSDIAEAKRFRRIAQHNLQQRARAYLKIEDGCDQFCHYCIIPHVRGPVRSLPLEQAVAQAEDLIASGRQEIVLSGIHIGAYGSDLKEENALVTLICRLCALPGLLRLRLGSIEPQQFTEPLLALLAEEPKLCRHLHIPLQSGCDKTLSAMGRHYDSAYYAALLAKIRALAGDIAFTSDVMVGFPGETEADFLQSMEFCRSAGFANLHIFPYSRREGTPAATFPDQVLQAVKAERAARLAAVAEQGAKAYAQRYLGKTLLLLVEERIRIGDQFYLRGHSDNYLTLLLPDPGTAEKTCPVRLVALLPEGVLVEKSE